MEWNDFFSLFVQGLLTLIVPTIAAAGLRWLWLQGSKAWEQFRQSQPDVCLQIEWAANMAIKAAEQAGAANLIDDKKAYALDIAERWLAAKGLKVDLDLVAGAIEAEVYKEFNGSKDIKSVGFVP
jgi:hypothetical protein